MGRPEVRLLLKRLQRPRVQECLDRGSPYWFFRYREDQALPEGGLKTTRKRHILAPSQGRNALSQRQAETARDRFLAALQAPPPTPLAAPVASLPQPAVAADLCFGQLADVWRRDFVEGQAGGRAVATNPNIANPTRPPPPAGETLTTKPPLYCWTVIKVLPGD